MPGPSRRRRACLSDVPLRRVSVDRERAGPARLRLGQRHGTRRPCGSRRSSPAGSSTGPRSSARSTTSRPTACSTLHFEATGLGTGLRRDPRARPVRRPHGSATGWSARCLVNGVRFGGPRGFWLPQLEPEKVLAQPLELALAGEVPLHARGHRHGRRRSDLRRRRQAREPRCPALHRARSGSTGSRSARCGCSCSRAGAAAASCRTSRRRTTTSSPADDGRQFNLLRSITAQQLVSAAGRSMLVERELPLLRLPDQQPRPSRRASARPWPPTGVCTATRRGPAGPAAPRGRPGSSSRRRTGSSRSWGVCCTREPTTFRSRSPA